MKSTMTRNNFETLIKTYGADPMRWPNALRADALTYRQDKPDAAHMILAKETELDALLDTQHQPETMPQLLIARIQSKAAQTPQTLGTALSGANDRDAGNPHTTTHPMPGWRTIAATLLIAAGFGFGAGQFGQSGSEVDSADLLLAMSFDTQYTQDDFYKDQDMSDTQTKKRQIWIPILILSLVLNGFMAGMLISKLSPIHPAAKAPRKTSEIIDTSHNPRRLLRALPHERRRAVSKQAYDRLQAQEHEKPRKLFQALQKSRKDLAKLIAQKPLNADRLNEVLVEMRTLNTQITQSGDALFKEILTSLTPQEREIIAKQMQNRGKRRRPQKQGRP